MWFWYAFGSAILGSVSIILEKKALNKVSASVLSWSLFTLSIPIVAYIALKESMPLVNQLFWIGVFGSSLAFVFFKTITNEVLKRNFISKVLPLTAFSGLFTYIFGLFFLGESIRFIPFLGLFSIILGSYILNADQAKEDLLKPFKILFTNKESLIYLFAIMIGSITGIFDKLGYNNTFPRSPAFIITFEQIIMSLLIGVYVLRKEKTTWLSELRSNFGLLLTCSMIFLATSFLVFYAYNDGPVALVLVIKRLQIFFILIMSYFFFKDKPTKRTWIATAVMILGAVMIKLG